VSVIFRHPISILLVAGALAATGAAFAFARPQYRPPYKSKMIDFARVRYYSPGTVKAAFAEHGVALRRGAAPAGMTWFGGGRRPFTAGALQVIVGPRRGKGSWGPELEAYDERFGNVYVSYGGKNVRLLERIKAAVEGLR
jgi:hypothetical protein